MIYITKKRSHRILIKLENFIKYNNNLIFPKDIIKDLESTHLWDYWLKTVRRHYYSSRYDLKLSRKKALSELKERFKKELLV